MIPVFPFSLPDLLVRSFSSQVGTDGSGDLPPSPSTTIDGGESLDERRRCSFLPLRYPPSRIAIR